MADFLVLAFIAGAALALVTGPLGALVVWRRMAYFGDTLAHSSLLGVALGLFLQIHTGLAVLLSSLVLALVLVLLQQQRHLASDTVLGILSHTALAAGLVCVSLFSAQRIDLFSFLFGDLLTASPQEVVVITLLALAVLAVLVWAWRPLVLIALDEDLARAEGIRVHAWQTLLMLLMALVIALAMKVVGVLLITALLIIPAAAARQLSASPEAMAVGASALGVLSVLLGLAASAWWDTPAGPSVVLSASLLFALSLGWRSARG
jgi:zinc transport system permease protein